MQEEGNTSIRKNRSRQSESLAPRFQQPSYYVPPPGSGYQLLPLRFLALDSRRYIVTNLVGQHVVLPRETLRRLLAYELATESPHFLELEARQFVLRLGEKASRVALDLLATQYRTKTAPIADFTSLHILVVTLRCDTACKYCQVSRVSENRTAYDMSSEVADRAIELVFRSPSPQLKIEFQGGEPLLNFPIIQRAIERADSLNARQGRALSYVVTTNLAPLNDPILHFLRERGAVLSTSLDGPRALHNGNRPRTSGDSYERTIEGIHRAREVLGPRSVSALMTTTKASLDQPEAIIDEYVRLGFDSVFLRPMSPFGFARSAVRLSYSAAEWNAFYEKALRYIIKINREGIPFREDFASIILRRLLTPYPTGYVDLQSPSGLGISVAVYNYDGDVYPSDEARMLVEAGDRAFRLGSVLTNSYEEIFYSPKLQELLVTTMSEGIPQCADCAFQPICGTDPVLHHATQGDVIGHRPTSEFCARSMYAMKLLVALLEDDSDASEVLRGWAF